MNTGLLSSDAIAFAAMITLIVSLISIAVAGGTQFGAKPYMVRLSTENQAMDQTTRAEHLSQGLEKLDTLSRLFLQVAAMCTVVTAALVYIYYQLPHDSSGWWFLF